MATTADVAVTATPEPVKPSRYAFKDEGRDVLAEVLNDPSKQGRNMDASHKELVVGESFKPVDVAPPAPPVEEKPPVAEVKPPEPPPVEVKPVVETKPPEPPVLLANKFKDVGELEKGYLELQKSFTQTAQKAAAAAAEVPAAATPEATEEARLKMINDFLTDPEATIQGIEQRMTERNQAARAVEAHVETWRSTNKDLAPYERFVAAEMHALTSADPNLDPLAALTQATTGIRSIVGALRSDGAKEALSVQQSVTPTAAVRVNIPPPTEHPAKAPMTEQEARDTHFANLTAEAARVRRPLR